MTHTASTRAGVLASLAVPASDPRRLAKALASGAQEVVVDLEDAVPASGKEAARAVLADFDWSTAPPGLHLAVRINGLRSRWWHRDLEVVVERVPAASVVVPKVESRSDVAAVERLLDGLEAEASARDGRLGVQALVETAAGVAALAEVVAAPDRLVSVILGYADLAASLGRARGAADESWGPIRQAVLLHCRSAGLSAVDGPHLGVADDESFRRAATVTADLGFDAKWVIHPRQIGTLVTTLRPDQAEIQRAEEVIAGLREAERRGRGAAQLDGELIDEAMAVAARRVLARRDALVPSVRPDAR